MPVPSLKPMLSYYGGDQRLANRLLELVESIPHKVWVECFCGGATLTFKKPKKYITNKSDYREVINDSNQWIYTFYKVARDRPDELNWKIQHTLHSKDCHTETKRILKEGSTDPLEIAWAVYVQCNQSFANEMFCGWERGILSQNHGATWSKKLKQASFQLERLTDLYIDNIDAVELIKKWDSVDTLFYCDPPYVNTNQGHYKGYTQNDLDNLIQSLENCKGSFILNCYDNPSIPSHWKRLEIKTKVSASKRDAGEKRGTECDRVQVITWMNRTQTKQPPLLDLLG